MASLTPLCGVCDFRHVSIPAVVWCSDCEEGFCTECSDHHSSAKVSRHHTTKSIEDYQKLPANIQKIEQFCKEHDEKFTLFCKEHDLPCCRTCIVLHHKQCHDISRIEDVVQNVKNSNAFQETEQILKELTENIHKIKKDREENIKSLQNSRIRIEKEIKEFREKLNNHIDNLQENIMKELQKVEEKERTNIQKMVQDLQEMEKDIGEMNVNISNIKQYASDLQAYLAIKQIQNDVDSKEAAVDSLVNSDKLHQKTILLGIHSVMNDLLFRVNLFGNIMVETKGCNVVLTKKKNQQVPLLVPFQPRTIDDITVQLKHTMRVESSNIMGCYMLPDGKSVFTSCTSPCRLIFMNPDGKENTTMSVQPYPFDVTYLKDKECLAVTHSAYNSSSITIINIKSNKIENNIKINAPSYGIAEKNNTLYFSTIDSIHSVNLTDKIITKFNEQQYSYGYIEIFENSLYQTSCLTNRVICYDLSGEVKWEFKDESILKGPMGISADNQGNLYVAGCNTSNIVVISPDGQKCRELLSNKDKISYPRALHYDRSTDNLLFANRNGMTFLYKVI